jgi:protein arginine N-methyltransferase 5
MLETPYLDNLQSPLQPLGDHLEYQTYETFERDPVKYERYGHAIYLALLDGMGMGWYPSMGSKGASFATSMDLADSNMEGGHNDDRDGRGNVAVDVHRVTILVVGAGRGPLVREAVSAVARASASLARGDRGDGSSNVGGKALCAKIVAIEKNPSAVLYLRGLKRADPSWNGGREYDPHDATAIDDDDDGSDAGTSVVTVVGCDMREASSHPLLGQMVRDHTRRADIVVSELLGSFGDNELSPECLDGVQRCGVLKENCVSIPQR